MQVEPCFSLELTLVMQAGPLLLTDPHSFDAGGTRLVWTKTFRPSFSLSPLPCSSLFPTPVMQTELEPVLANLCVTPTDELTGEDAELQVSV